MARPLRVGIISANWGAAVHLPAWRALDGVEVVAICTSRRESAEQAAADFAVERPFWDYREMVADPEIDLIDVGTSPVQRQAMILAAIAGGKHVVNQLPFAVDAAGAKRMNDALNQAGSVGAVAASVVGLPQLRLMKQMIDEGYLGELFQVHCHWQMSYFNPVIPNFSYLWFGDPGHGVSVTRNQGSHMLHALYELFGPIHSVVGKAKTALPQWEVAPGQFREARTDDTMAAMLQFENGAIGTMSTSWVGVDSPGFRIEAFGKDGYLRLESAGYPNPELAKLHAAKANPYVFPTAREVPLPGSALLVDGRPIATENGSQVPSIARIFASVRDAVNGGPAPLCSFERAVAVQQAVEAIYASQETGAWVVVGP